MSNQNTKTYYIKYEEPKITKIAADIIQTETRYTYAPISNININNLNILLFIFNAMCPKKYKVKEASSVFLEKNKLFHTYKCWVDDERTGEPFIIAIFDKYLQDRLYGFAIQKENFSELEELSIIDFITDTYKRQKCMVCDTECKKKCLCGMVYYCCEEHQKQDRKIHKRICQASKV